MRNVDREQAYLKRLQAVGQLMEAVDNGRVCEGLEGGTLTGFTVKAPSTERPEVLVVVKARVGSEEYVAFVGALDLVTALLTWAARERTTGLKWRPNVPWEERRGRGHGG